MSLDDKNLLSFKDEIVQAFSNQIADKEVIAGRLSEVRSADIGEMLDAMVEDDGATSVAISVLDTLSPERAANVLGYLAGDNQLEIVGGLQDSELQALLEEMG